MKQIIEHGYKKYTTICKNCNCHFSYEIEDVEQGSVSCPDCGDTLVHSPSSWCCGSQIKEIDNE